MIPSITPSISSYNTHTIYMVLSLLDRLFGVVVVVVVCVCALNVHSFDIIFYYLEHYVYALFI